MQGLVREESMDGTVHSCSWLTERVSESPTVVHNRLLFLIPQNLHQQRRNGEETHAWQRGAFRKSVLTLESRSQSQLADEARSVSPELTPKGRSQGWGWGTFSETRTDAQRLLPLSV